MKHLRLLFVLLLLTVAAIALLYAVPSDREVSTVRYSHTLDSLNHAPLIVAQAAGFFEDYGLIMEYLPMTGGEEAALALSTGQIDIASGSTTQFLSAIDSGAPIRNTNITVLVPVQLMVRADSGLKTFEDLKGKVIATRVGSGSDLALRHMIAQEGLDAEAIEFAYLDRSTQLLALTQQKIVDAVVISQREVLPYEEAGAVILDAWAESTYSTEFTPGTIAMNTEFLANRPEDAQRFIDALIDGYEYMESYPEESADLIIQTIESYSLGETILEKDQVLAYLTGGEAVFVLWHDPAILEKLAELMAEVGSTSRPLTLDEIYNDQFDEQLKSAHERLYGQTD